MGATMAATKKMVTCMIEMYIVMLFRPELSNYASFVLLILLIAVLDILWGSVLCVQSSFMAFIPSVSRCLFSFLPVS